MLTRILAVLIVSVTLATGAAAGPTVAFTPAAFFMGRKMQEIRPGMSEPQVVQTLGRPDGFKVQGNCKALTYTNRLISGWAWDRADFYVVLCDGKVTEAGSGEVRQGQNPNRFIFVVPVQ